jgi:alkanesulfonate monooxygenase SsuD/methylene tetrahydromethanopterin reductase-like flavin-dependent oxidoreductase (luciferase family)
LPLRHLLQAAAQAAVLDRLSGGRLILGVGRGFAAELFRAYGIAPAEKREIFAECLARMLAAWRGEPLTASGARLSPLPLQQPHPPVWVAAFGPKALAQAGSLGLPYLASPLETLATLQRNHALHAEACDAAGHARPTTVPLIRSVFVSRDRAALDGMRTALERRMAAMRARGNALPREIPATLDDWALIGEPEAVADRLAQYRSALGITHLVVTQLQLAGPTDAAWEASLDALLDIAARQPGVRS